MPNPDKKFTRSTRQILRGPNHILHSVYAETRKLAEISEIVEAVSQVEVAVSSFKNNQLVISVATAAIATRLRYRQNNIISRLRHRNFDVQSLKIRVDPGYFDADRPNETGLSTTELHTLLLSL